jgi:hypothetical protein
MREHFEARKSIFKQARAFSSKQEHFEASKSILKHARAF